MSTGSYSMLRIYRSIGPDLVLVLNVDLEQARHQHWLPRQHRGRVGDVRQGARGHREPPW